MTRIVRVSKPIVTGLGKTATPEDIDAEPFMLRDRTAEEVAEYDAGFKAGSQGGASEEGNTDAWCRGWAEAQE
jgi:hypothetical protein